MSNLIDFFRQIGIILYTLSLLLLKSEINIILLKKRFVFVYRKHDVSFGLNQVNLLIQQAKSVSIRAEHIRLFVE